MTLSSALPHEYPQKINAFGTSYLVPPTVPGRDPSLCASREPSSLLNAAAKLLETASHFRLIPLVEPQPNAHQYADRRAQETEHLPTELVDFAYGTLCEHFWANIISFDVLGAPKFVPNLLSLLLVIASSIWDIVTKATIVFVPT